MNRIDQGSCPYLPNRRWVSHAFAAGQLTGEVYESLINEGWRRSGSIFYRNCCPACSLCIPIRVPVSEFSMSDSQRRVMRRNRDVEVSYHEIAPDEAIWQLYRTYQRERHGRGAEDGESWESYVKFLGESPVPTMVMRYTVGDELIGAGWIDLLPEGISSVYFAYDPRHASRSPGTLSALHELRFASELGREWYYLGFFVPGCPSMSYKARFRPYELLIDGRWYRW